jgi:hypothetical protein
LVDGCFRSRAVRLGPTWPDVGVDASRKCGIRRRKRTQT